MAVTNNVLVPRFPPKTFEALRETYLEIVKNALPDPEKYPEYCRAHWAIVNNQMDGLRSHLSSEQVKAVLTQQAEKSAREYDFTADPVEDHEVEEEIRRTITENYSPEKLSPLHIAAMTGNLVAAQILVGSGKCNVNQKDGGGATASHHAAVLGNREFIQYLEQNGADPGITDNHGGTVQDIWTMIHHPIDQGAQSFLFQMPSGEVVNETGLQFYDRTKGVLLTSTLVLSPLQWIEDWKNSGEELKLKGFERDLRDRYIDFKSQPLPRVIVKEDPTVGYYLCAGQFIPRYSIVGEYLGKIDFHEWKEKENDYERMVADKSRQIEDKNEKYFAYAENPSTDYGLERIDAYAFRGLMGLVADSFPNIISHPVMSASGVVQRTLFIAATDIQNGEILAFDYGRVHQTKKIPFKELRQDAMETFFQSHTEAELLEILKKSKKYPEGLDERLEILSLQGQLEYLLHSPTAMLSLYLKGMIKVSTLKNLFNARKSKPKNDLEAALSLFQTQTMQEKFLEALDDFDLECQEEDNVSQVQSAKTALVGMLGKVPTVDLYRYLLDPPPFQH